MIFFLLSGTESNNGELSCGPSNAKIARLLDGAKLSSPVSGCVCLFARPLNRGVYNEIVAEQV